MTSTSKNTETTIPGINKTRLELFSSVADWTKQETTRVISQTPPRNHFIAKSQKVHILSEDLPATWKQYQKFRGIVEYESGLEKHRIDPSLILKTNHHALKATSLARTAFVLAGIEQGAPLERANEIAGVELARYGNQLAAKTMVLPPYRLLDASIEDAVDTYN